MLSQIPLIQLDLMLFSTILVAAQQSGLRVVFLRAPNFHVVVHLYPLNICFTVLSFILYAYSIVCMSVFQNT